MSDFAPTPEQTKALDLFATGDSMVIEAGAGAGKTSTLRLLAESTPRTGFYLAFNKAIVAEAGAKMPGNVTCSTAHGLAFRAVAGPYRHRMNGPRQKANDVAKRLGINPITIVTAVERKRLAPGYLAGVVNRAVTRFCQSADPEPTEAHFDYIEGIDLPSPDGRRGWANNREVRLHLLPALRAAWADLSSPTGWLRFGHDHYLKLWHLSGPRIAADFVLFDEAQDANPVMRAIVEAQEHAQRVYVGDSQQAIYGFTGAVNALALVDVTNRAYLTQSFRFGPAVATEANRALSALNAELRIKGTPTIASTVGPIADPDVVLTRTNAKAVELFLDYLAAGEAAAVDPDAPKVGRPHIVGGATEVVAFAKGAKSLMEDAWTSHPELACFSSWAEVVDYVDNDQQGGELRLLVGLVEKFTAEVIIDSLGGMIPEAQASVIISTAHKAKGREWDRVQLAGDFPNGKNLDGTERRPEPEELRLVYVAITRARRELDLGPAVSDLLDFVSPAAAAAPAGPATAATTWHDLTGVVEAPMVGNTAAALRAPELVEDVAEVAPPARVCPDCHDPATARTNGMIGAHVCTALSASERAARLRGM
jgi:hypothetical protein